MYTTSQFKIINTQGYKCQKIWNEPLAFIPWLGNKIINLYLFLFSCLICSSEGVSIRGDEIYKVQTNVKLFSTVASFDVAVGQLGRLGQKKKFDLKIVFTYTIYFFYQKVVLVQYNADVIIIIISPK